MKKVGQIIRETVTDIVGQNLKDSANTFVVGYSKVSSTKMGDLRKALSQAGAKMYASKNRIAQRALNDADYKELGDKIQDQTVFVWSDADSVEVAKVLMKYAKDLEGMNVHGGILEGKTVFESEVQRLSDLPSRDVLLAMVLQAIQSPLTRLAGALNGKTRELILLLKQLSEKAGGN